MNSLENRVHELEKENRYLKSLLDKAGISYALPQPSHSDYAMQADQGSRIVHVTISKDMVNAFYSYFKGRNDVCTLRAVRPNKKTGKYGYDTQCWNFWKDGICPKKSGVKISCGDCKNRN